ncbi:hypothetical protein C0995_006493 [Termitomyces sp. Mi166|nr:hypothetical protein C0995_006493 [Termitomyces sp. Mi166\
MPQTRKRTKPEKSMSLRSKGKPKLTQSKPTFKSNVHEPSSGEDDEGGDYNYDPAYRGEAGKSDEDKKEDSYDSDAIDEDDFVVGTKRKRSASGSSRSPKKSKTTIPQKKKAKSKKERAKDLDEDEDATLELGDGQEVVGVVVQAPKTGQGASVRLQAHFDACPDTIFYSSSWSDIPKHAQFPDAAAGSRMQRPFKLHEPVYRQAENEWKAFVEAVTDQITEADPQVPPLPPKDLIHRIYRDIRFSNDKTPYKNHFSAGFSRSGRKGIWAGLQPGGESIVAAGSWCPARNELMNIRTNLRRQAGADRLREVISAPEFVAYFGEPQPSKDGSRQSIFGREDELKVAPKGIDKNHRLASFVLLSLMRGWADRAAPGTSIFSSAAPSLWCIGDTDGEDGGGSGGDD